MTPADAITPRGFPTSGDGDTLDTAVQLAFGSAAMGPSPRSHQAFTARWAAGKFVQYVVALLGLLVFAILALATDLGRSIGMVALGAICAGAGIALYFPLAWAAVRWVESRMASGGRPPTPPGSIS